MACQAELIRSLGRARLVLMLIKLPLLFTANSSRESEIRAVGRKHFAGVPINNSISVCYDVGRPKFEILRWAGSNDWRSSFPAESFGGPNVGGTSTSQDQPSISFRKTYLPNVSELPKLRVLCVSVVNPSPPCSPSPLQDL